jgi:hypothetical protein
MTYGKPSDLLFVLTVRRIGRWLADADSCRVTAPTQPPPTKEPSLGAARGGVPRQPPQAARYSVRLPAYWVQLTTHWVQVGFKLTANWVHECL